MSMKFDQIQEVLLSSNLPKVLIISHSDLLAMLSIARIIQLAN